MIALLILPALVALVVMVTIAVFMIRGALDDCRERRIAQQWRNGEIEWSAEARAWIPNDQEGDR